MSMLKEIEPHAPKILLMGIYGTGKTVFATSAGKGTVVIDLDNGLKSVRTFQDQFHKARQEIEVKKCWEDDPEKAVSFLKARSFITGIARDIREGKSEYKVLVLDSYTKLADGAVRHIMDQNGMLGKPPRIQHWGMAFLEIENLLLILHSLPIAVIVIAHLRRIEDDGVSRYEIATPGQKLPEKIPTYFDEVWATQIRGTGTQQKYTIQTRGSTLIPCRTRSQVEDDINQNLGLREILRRMNYVIE